MEALTAAVKGLRRLEPRHRRAVQGRRPRLSQPSVRMDRQVACFVVEFGDGRQIPADLRVALFDSLFPR
jgi:hypothetical protein